MNILNYVKKVIWRWNNLDSDTIEVIYDKLHQGFQTGTITQDDFNTISNFLSNL